MIRQEKIIQLKRSLRAMCVDIGVSYTIFTTPEEADRAITLMDFSSVKDD
jgi:hypothetical protein